MSLLATITLTLPYFIVMAGILLAAGVLLTIVTVKPSRQCPLCENRITLDRRRCKHCGYDTVSIRGVN